MPVTYKNLYRSICDFDNLLEAYSRARRGKQQTDEMRRFHFKLEMNLWDLHAELKDGTYQPGPYRHFRIVTPNRARSAPRPSGTGSSTMPCA
jgi:RNA-directed DNA polymerase